MRGFVRLGIGLCLANLFAGCEAPAYDIYVDLKTDVVGLREFTVVRTEIIRGAIDPQRPDSPMAVQQLEAQGSDAVDYGAGVRIAEFERIAAKKVTVKVSLLGPGGNVLARRDVLLHLRGNMTTTVVISRDCREVECPGDGESALFTTCVAGSCVDPRCSPAAPEFCASPECVGDADCGGESACTVNRCVDGSCLAFGDDSACDSGETCSPESGCVPGNLVPGTPVQTIAAGYGHTCMIDGGEVFCWGSNFDSVLGTPFAELYSASEPTAVAGITDAIQVDAGRGSHVCALRETGAITCWGLNSSGQVGVGDDSPYYAPPSEVVGITDAVEVAVGNGHTCARHATGAVSCWGAIGTEGVDVFAPMEVDLPPATRAHRLSANASHTCAILDTGRVVCWGSNFNGELGDPTFTEDYSAEPREVTGIEGVEEIDAGFGWTCARNASGVSCWGINGCGQLGIGARTSDEFLRASEPTPVVGLPSDVVQVEAGDDCHTCARTLSGDVWCWGVNDCLQLGTADETGSDVPSQTSVTGAVEISTGGSHTCAILPSGEYECWGANWAGELGDGRVDSFCGSQE